MRIQRETLARHLNEILPDKIAGDFWEAAVGIASKHVHSPMCFIAIDTKMLIVSDFEISYEVDQIVRALSKQADVVVFAHEAYRVRAGDNAIDEYTEQLYREGRLGEHPHCDLVLVVTVQHRCYGTVRLEATITDGIGDRLVGDVIRRQVTETTKEEGLFTNIFPAVPVGQA
jgi:hypothetical protein